jgi:hypothetical protein
MTVLAYSSAFGCAVWFLQAGLLWIHLGRLRRVAASGAAGPAGWPRVSAIVPARDEERSIGDALVSRLADDYPDLEVIVVDDRSTDRTGEVIARIAADDRRVRAIRVDELPSGWLGKVHALARGTEAATGDWLLVSDADIEMKPGGLRRAVAYCEAEGLDFLALVPEFRSPSFLVDVAWTVFMRVLGTFVDPSAVRDPASRTAMGSGGFMLARRAVFDRTPGFEHLCLDTTDDISLGVMMKRAGARCDFADGRGIARIGIYHNLRELFRGVEKNAGSLVQAPLAAVVGAICLAGLFEFAPFAALLSGVDWLVWLGALAAVAGTAASVSALHRNTGLVAPALLWPLGWAIISAAILRSAWLLHRRGGVVWRDTFYSREELLAGQRFRAL